MVLHVMLKVKFRAFFITFAEFNEQWQIPLPIPVKTEPQQLIVFNKRGVDLRVGLG